MTDPLIRAFVGADGRLTQWPSKRKKQLATLCYLAQAFEPGRRYTESEVNDIIDLKTCFHDPATLRRDLYDMGFLCREKDGSAYWCSDTPPTRAQLGLPE